MKRLIIVFLLIIFSIIVGYTYYKYQNRTIECWFTLLYPQFNYTDGSTIGDNIAQFKLAIVEWFKNRF